jgi:L-amino acid N-acyltransferase YncA
MSDEVKRHAVSGFDLRRGAPADMPALVAMYESFEPKGAALGLPPRANPERWLADVSGFPNFVVSREGRIVGHGLVCPDGDAAEVAVFVHQSERSRGLGKWLLSALVDEARQLGLRRIWGTTDWENVPMLRLAHSLGFVTGADPEVFTLELPAEVPTA